MLSLKWRKDYIPKPEGAKWTTIKTDEMVEDQWVIENETNILFLSNWVDVMLLLEVGNTEIKAFMGNIKSSTLDMLIFFDVHGASLLTCPIDIWSIV